MLRKRIGKVYSLVIIMMIILSPLTSIFLWDGLKSVTAENPLTPVTTITGLDNDDNFGWNVSWVGDVNGDGFDDIIVGAPYTDRYGGVGNWWNSNWSYRKKLTFNNSGQLENLLNFPVLVKLDSSNFDYLKAKSDGSDLRFIDDDSLTELNYEIESWNSSGNSFIWVNVTSITGASSTDFIWMYYGNIGAINGENPSEVWDSNYVMVQHLEENATGTRFDSTKYGSDGFPVNYDGDEAVSGILGGADDFDGLNDFLNFGNPVELQITGAITLEVWFRADFVDNDFLLAKMGENGEMGWDLSLEDWLPIAPDGYGEFRYSTNGSNLNSIGWERINASEWCYLVGEFNPSTCERFFLNGIMTYENTMSVPPALFDPPVNIYLAHAVRSSAIYFDGIIDEVRISNIARSKDWISAQYLSMNNTYITYGGEETKEWWNTEWSYRKKLTFDNSGQSEELVNFPVLFNLSSSNFDYSNAKSDGTDLRFIDADGSTQLKYHIEDWNPSGCSYTWVNVTSIDGASSSDYIWMYYGNSAASDVQDVSGTYDTNFLAVWHLNETGTGIRYDSTSNDYDGTPENYDGDEATTGKIDGADNFNQNNDIINVSSMNPQSYDDFTIEAWYQSNMDTGTDDGYMFDHGIDESVNPEIEMGFSDDFGHEDRLVLKILDNGVNSNRYYGTSDIVDQQLHYLVAVRDNGRIKLYVDGVMENNETDVDAGEIISIDTGMGPYIGDFMSTSEFINGILDEVRVSDKARSSDWVKLQYLSMNNSFITYAGEEILSEDCGATYIFFGYPGITMNNLNTTNANVTIYGSNAGDLFGWSVADAGDVNNDDYDDIIIGAPGWGTDRGRAYIFHGRATSSWSTTYDADADADAILTGENDGDKFGFSVSGAGNVNNEDCLDGWLYRKKITINASKVTGDLIEFPMLISIMDTDLKNKACTDGYDIMFTESDGITKLAHEIESYKNSSGELIAWVQIPNLSSTTDTVIYMCYGNPTAPDQSNPKGVWDLNYTAVWHLNKTGAGNADEFKDSTSNANHGQGGGGTGSQVPNRVTGKIGNGQEFDEIDDNIDCGNDSSLDLQDPLTIEAWIYPTGWGEGTYGTIIARGAGGFIGYQFFTQQSTEDVQIWDGAGSVGSGFSSIKLNSWQHVVVVIDSGGTVQFYVNGSAASSGSYSIDTSGSNTCYIGSIDGSSETFNGTIDEVRVSNVVRSANWIATEFSNQNDPSTFSTLGDEESNVNNDDVIVGAYGYDGERGRAYLFFGGSEFTGEISAGNADLIINGTTSNDRLGWDVSRAGDVNNDGFGDVIVGAPGNNSNAGAAYIFCGNNSMPSFIDANDADRIIIGSGEEELGFSVSYVMDVNNDGYDDVIIGAPGYNFNQGRAYIFCNYGLNDIVIANNGDDTVSIYKGTSAGWEAESNLGVGVEPRSVFIGDANNDGYNDIVAADWGDETVSIYNGTSSGGWESRYTLSAPGSPWVVFVGDANNDGLNDIVVNDFDNDKVTIYNGTSNGGWDPIFQLSVGDYPRSVYVGDANNDGYNDILTSEVMDNTVTIYNGTSGGSWDPKFNLSVGNYPRWVFVGDANNDGYNDVVTANSNDDSVTIYNGTTIGNWEPICTLSVGSDPRCVFIGDANNDGYNDILASNYASDTVTIYNGTNDNGWGANCTLSVGNGPMSVFVADANNDGYNDILTADYWVDNTVSIFNGTSDGLWEGKYTLSTGAYPHSVFVGNANNDGMGGSINANNANLILTGVSTGDKFGISVGSAGDLNGDGFHDIIVGAPFYDDGAKIDAGAIYVFEGGAPEDSTVDWSYKGEYANDHFGWSVSFAGDVNDDGLLDLFVGAPNNDDGGTDAGKAYLLSPLSNEPVITGVAATPSIQNIGGYVNITCSVTAFSGVDSVWVNITLPDGKFINESLTPGVGNQWFYNNNYTIPGIYQYTIWANDTNGNSTESGIYFFEVINSYPSLSSSQVNPPVGYTDTGFNFSVIYTDLDNHAPNNITVNITGIGFYDLIELDPSDTDYTDGKAYYCNLSGLAVGSYSFHFAANDTIGYWTETGILLFDVLESSPMISLEQVNPPTGNTDTRFNFTVTYIHPDNQPPNNITVNITGVGIYELIEVDPLDTDYNDGKDYYYNASGFDVGQYSFHFAANDTNGNWNESGILMFEVLNRVPILSFGQVLPATGYIDTWFNFTVTYSDPDNHAPYIITVNITGFGIYDLIELDPSDTDYTDGKAYYYNVSGFAIGYYTFHFAANDTFGNWTETGILQFDVINRGPMLSLEQVDPTTGYIDTWFNFTVTYTDLDNHAPDFISVNISGIGIYNLLEADLLDTVYNDGKEYYYNFSGLAIGSYTFHFAANDTFGNWIETGILRFDVINRGPMLSLEQVDPPNGYIETWFNFSVTYTDLDNHTLDIITVNITGVGVYDLIEVDLFDTDYSDGKDYYYNASGFTLGQYSFHFAANDTYGNWTESGILQFDVINRIPVLTSGQVNPSVGDMDTSFNFSVNYTDLDNHAPDIITVNITGIGIYDLIALDPLDMDYTDGKIYYFNTSGFPIGSYSFKFAANDTQGDWIESMVMNFDVIDRVPTLLSEQVDPITGYIDTWFNFTVTYVDLDNHAPVTITLNITGIGVFDLVEVDLLDTVYTDGKGYYYYTSGFGIGSFSFHFAANDTNGNWIESGILQFDVLNRAPMLTLGQVDPTIGYSDTLFNFTVNYTDIDNHAPLSIILNLSGPSGGIFALVEVDPSDTDYTDGKEYYYNTTLSSGLYSFHFAANDLLGMWAVETTEINDPDIIAKHGTLDAIDYTGEYSDEIFLNATLLDDDNNPISNQNVAFYIDKNKNGIYEVGEYAGAGTTQVDGNVSTIYTANIAYGMYNFKVIYIGSGDHVVDDDEALLIIYAKGATLTAISDIVEEDEVVSLTAVLIDIHGNPISFEQVELFIDKNKDGIYYPSESIGSSTTSTGGVALITYTVNLAPENYGIWAKYMGSGNYSVTEIEGLLTVQNVGNRPPSILGKIPDQIKPEDSLPWPLDLTSYEGDLEDSGPDLKWYLTGIDTSLYSVTGMNSSDDIITFIPVPDAFGNDEVILWLWDSNGDRVSQVLWVNITPVNDQPYFKPLPPNLFVHYDNPNTEEDDPSPWDYTFYVHDIESPIEDLIITTSEPTVDSGQGYAVVDGLKVTFHYPQNMVGKSIPVVLTLSDGTDDTHTMIWVNVTSDWVPELVDKLPDIILEENTTLYNVFDLDDYFIDKDHDSLYFSTGYFHIKVNINENNTVDITALGGWTGSEFITFRAWDPIGAIAEDIIKVTVIPVNNPPVISGVPDLVVHYDYSYAFDLSPYIFDSDNQTHELIVWTSEATNFIWLQQQNNLGIVVNYPESMNGMTIPVTIYVSDGMEIASQDIQISVTSDFPPELINNLPDIFFDEDTVLRNAFLLSDYFIDIDGDVLFYTNGTKFINATINENLTVDFSAPENWYGSEIVTFRATDPMGALAEDKILVVVVPVNDAPTIGSIPKQEKNEGDQWILDLSEYINDIDNDLSELVITVNSEIGQGYVNLVGNILIFQYPKGIQEDIITVTVSDGELEASRSFIVNIRSSKQIVPTIWDMIPWLWVFLFLIGIIGGAFIFYRKRSVYLVHEAFLIHEKGLPIAHASKEEISELEDVIVSGMFTAVQNFISDAFAGKTSEDDWELDEMKFGDNKILIERSLNLFLAVIFEGNGRTLRNRVKKLLRDINEEYGAIFKDWDGEMAQLTGVTTMIVSLISRKELKLLRSKHFSDQSKENVYEEEFEDVFIDQTDTKPIPAEDLDQFIAGVEISLLEGGVVKKFKAGDLGICECPVCGKDIRENDTKCPRCGVGFVSTQDPETLHTLKQENGEIKKSSKEEEHYED